MSADSAQSEPGDRPWALLLRGLTLAATVSALLALLLPGRAGSALGWAAVGLVLAGPIVRVAMPARQWARPGDRRFLLAAVLVTIVLPVGAALLSRGA